MQLRIQHAHGSRTTSFTLDNISATTMVDVLRQRIAEKLALENSSSSNTSLRLICLGKILDDGQTLWNYQIKTGMTVFVQQRSPMNKDAANNDSSSSSSSNSGKVGGNGGGNGDVEMESAESKYFAIGQRVEMRNENGAYDSGRIVNIFKRSVVAAADENEDADGLIYVCSTQGDDDGVTENFELHRLRPRAREKLADIERIGGEDPKDVRYLVNYNPEHPKELGFWYEADLQSSRIDGSKRKPYLLATVYTVTSELEIRLPDCQITKLDEIYLLPKRFLKQENVDVVEQSELPSRTKLDCDVCFDNPKMKRSCEYCTCVECHKNENEHVLLVCDQCRTVHHTYCLEPPLDAVPEEEEDWYCPSCKNDQDEIVNIGQGVKLATKKLGNMPSAKTERRWGGKQSCDGRKSVCTIVSMNQRKKVKKSLRPSYLRCPEAPPAEAFAFHRVGSGVLMLFCCISSHVSRVTGWSA